MSDLMQRAVLGMPYEMAMSDELSRLQFHDRAQQALVELDQLRTALAASQAREQLVRNALESVLEFAGTVAPGASWWDDVWPAYDGDKRMYQYDDTALREMIEAARMEELERIISILGKHVGAQIEDAIRSKKG